MIQFIPSNNFDITNLNNSTLIIPAINNIANIGQLTIDLVISSLKLKRVGYFDTPYILPIIGNDPYGDKGDFLATNIELYQTEDHSLSIIQIRAPVITKYGTLLKKELLEWIKTISFEQIILLSGADASRGNDKLLESFRLKVMRTGYLKNNETLCKQFMSLGWDKIEISPEDLKENTAENDMSISTDMNENETGDSLDFVDEPLIPGGGLAYKLFNMCENEKNIPMILMAWFTVEGDNVADALLLAKQLGLYLNKKDVNWIYPQSWKFLYGNLALSSLYTN